jgi:hypothetical protein
MSSIKSYQSNFFNPDDKQKANAQRGRLLDRLIREKMQTVIYKISLILPRSPAQDWLEKIRTLIRSQSESELAEVAE